MNTYIFYTKLDSTSFAKYIDNITIIKDGFSIFAFFFGIFWLLYHKLWKSFFVLLGILIITSTLYNFGVIQHTSNMLVHLVISFYIAFNGNDILQEKLLKKGYKLKGLFIARSRESALLKFSRI